MKKKTGKSSGFQVSKHNIIKVFFNLVSVLDVLCQNKSNLYNFGQRVPGMECKNYNGLSTA